MSASSPRALFAFRATPIRAPSSEKTRHSEYETVADSLSGVSLSLLASRVESIDREIDININILAGSRWAAVAGRPRTVARSSVQIG